jgi:hypothetical protein
MLSKHRFGRLMTVSKVISQQHRNTAIHTDTNTAMMEVFGTINKILFTTLPFVKSLFPWVAKQRLLDYVLNDYSIREHCLLLTSSLPQIWPGLSGWLQSKSYQKEKQFFLRSATSDERGNNIGRQEKGFLGLHLPDLLVADTQWMIFLANNWGPLHLTPYQQAFEQHDHPVGKAKFVRNPRTSFFRHSKLGELYINSKVVLPLEEKFQDFAGYHQIDEQNEHWEGKPRSSSASCSYGGAGTENKVYR